jgi:hypothetical protein
VEAYVLFMFGMLIFVGAIAGIVTVLGHVDAF